MPQFSTAFPIAGATGSSTSVTVDYLLANPDVLAADVVDIAAEEFWVTSFFDMGLRTTNGSVLIETASSDIDTDLYPVDDVERVTELVENPLIQGSRLTVTSIPIEEWGAAFIVSERMKRRGQLRAVTRLTTQLSNAMTRKMEQRGIAALDAALTAASRVTPAPQPLATINAKTYDAKTNNDWVLDSFVIAQTGAANAQRGANYNTVVINNNTKLKLGRALGHTNVEAAFATIDLKLETSVQVADGEAYIGEAGQFGGFAWELDPRVIVGDYDRTVKGYYVDGESAYVPYIDDVTRVEKITTL
jgi:hypothetical protein